MMFDKKNILIAFVTLMIVGCATVADGSKQELIIDSIPSGATLYKNKKIIGETPVRILVNRNEYNSFTLRKGQYKNQYFALKTKPNRITHLNAVALPVYGVTSTVDTFSGSIYRYEDRIIVELAKVNDSPKKERKCIGCRLISLS